jgi:hypothetical protein
VSSSSASAVADHGAKRRETKKPPRTAHDVTAAGNVNTSCATGTRVLQQASALGDQSKSRDKIASSALAASRAKNDAVHEAKQNVKQTVHKAKKQNVKQKPPRIARDVKESGNTGTASAASATAATRATGPRTPQQETAFLRALGLTERPRYPVAGEMYRMEFSEFRQHLSNKLPLYDGRAVTTLGSSRKSRNYKLVCALHPACPFLMGAKQQVYADGLAYQEIKEVVNHTCSLQSHADMSLCSANFLGYLLREDKHLLQTKGRRVQGTDVCAQAEKNFGIDLESKARRQMFYKAERVRNEQDDDSALSLFRTPSPICVTQVPMLSFEPYAQIIAENPQPKQKHKSCPSEQSERKSDQSMRREENQPSSAESTSTVVPHVPKTGVAENPEPRQSKRKSDQSKRRETNQSSSLECRSDSTTAKLATSSAESTSLIVPIHSAGVVDHSKPKQSKRKSVSSKESNPKSNQSKRREVKRKSEYESVARKGNVERKKRKVIHGRSTPATNALPSSDPAPQPTSAPNSSQRSVRKSKPEFLRLLDNYTPRVDELSARTSRPPCSTTCLASTMNQHSGTKTNADRIQKSNILAKRTPLPLANRSLKPDCEESAGKSLLSPALSFPLRKTRASSSTLQNTLGNQQPKKNLNQRSNSDLNPARVILGDGMTPAVEDLLPRRSAVSSTTTFTDIVAANRQPASKQDQQASSNAKRQPTRKLDGMTPTVNDLPRRRSGVVSPATSIDTIAAKRQPESKQDEQSSSIATQRSTRKVKSKQQILLECTTPAVDDLHPRRSGVSCTTTCTDTDPNTVVAKRQPESEQDEQSSSIATQRSTRKVKSEQHRLLLDGLAPVVDDLPPRRSAVSYTATYTETKTDMAASTIVHVNKIEGKQQKFSKRVQQQVSSTANTQPKVGDLLCRRTRASHTGAASVTLPEPGTKREKPVVNSTSLVGVLPSRRTRASYTGAATVTLSEPGTKLKLKHEKPVERPTPAVGDLPPRRTRASYTGAATVTLSEPGTKLKLKHEKPVENPTPAVGDLPPRRTRASYTGAATVTLSEPGTKLKLKHEKPVENPTSVVGDLPPRRTRASYTGAASVTLSEPGTKLTLEYEKPVVNATSVVGDLPSRRTRASYTGAATVTLSEPVSKPAQKCRKRSFKPEHESLLQKATSFSDELVPRRSKAITEVYSTKEQPDNKRSQNVQQSGDKMNHVPVRTLEHRRLLDNMAPVYEDLSPRKTRSSFHSEIGSTTQPRRSRLDKQPSRNFRSENGKCTLDSLPAEALIESVADSRQTNRKLEKHLSRKLRSEHATLKDKATPVLGDLPSRKTRASSTELVSTTLHLPSKLSQFEAGQPPNPKRKTEHEVLLGDCPGKKPRTIVSHPKLTGGTAVSRDTGPLWINPGELREVEVVVAETSAQISGPVVLFHVALVEEYRRLAARDVYEFVNFGLSLASTKAAIDFKLKELNLNMDKEHGDKDIEAERVDHSRSLKEFSRLADAERLEKIRESEEDVRQRLVADYHNRAKRVNPMRAEESALISRPIRFEEGMEVGRRNKEPCYIGPDCTFCQKASAQDIQPREEPLPRFRRFDITQLDSIDERVDGACASGDRARRNRPARVGKRAASRLALSEMRHSLSFVEELNSTERTISHRLF